MTTEYEKAMDAQPVAWVAADTLNSPHPTCISSLAYMSQLDRERCREYVPLYAAPVAALAAMAAQWEDDAWCAECGVKLENVRPGKHQHPTCSQAAPQQPAPVAPVEVEGLLQRIDAAIERVTTGRAAMRIPADPTDPDLVLADARNCIKQAAIAQQPAAHPAITHCDNCGCDWLDNGLNHVGCPYCKQNDWRAAFVAERATRYREGGMAIEQARIHAETDAALILTAALAVQQQGGAE